jgi:hypothetical protein
VGIDFFWKFLKVARRFAAVKDPIFHLFNLPDLSLEL